MASFKRIKASASKPWVRAYITTCSSVVTGVRHLTNWTNLKNEHTNLKILVLHPILVKCPISKNVYLGIDEFFNPIPGGDANLKKFYYTVEPLYGGHAL